MINRILGDSFGGTIRGGHHGLDSMALSLITPPNFGAGGGKCFPSIVVVALGEPSSPVVVWAEAFERKKTLAAAKPASDTKALSFQKVDIKNHLSLICS
jgi:hypothetical protein